jgi:hypothetical protein
LRAIAPLAGRGSRGSSGALQADAARSGDAQAGFLMRPNGRRLAGISVILLILVVVGAVGFWLGAAAHGRPLGALPMRGLGFRYPGFGLLRVLGPLLLIGLAVTFVVLLLREPGRPPAPPAPPDAVDRLREIAAMHDRGQLTDEEFVAAKRSLLSL